VTQITARKNPDFVFPLDMKSGLVPAVERNARLNPERVTRDSRL
jgi:hypothetical protein